jgi:glycosyltransferase involved in cell wall biosynthesis
VTGLRRGALTALVRLGTVAAVATTVHTCWNLTRLRSPSTTPGRVTECVSVMVPARDEAANIGRCVTAIRAQQNVAELDLWVLDDRSSDGTDQIVRLHVDDDPRVHLVEGADEPPPGWTGKAWACQRLAGYATGDVLVFVDADVVLEPAAVASAVELMRSRALDLVSPYPRQVAGSVSERLVQPLLQWSWLSFLPLGAAERSARPSLSAANGQFLIVDAGAYARAGGHAGVRSHVVEDVALLAAVKRAGGHGVVVDGTRLATCRMYDGWRELESGYTKSLWAAFGSPWRAVAVGAVLTVMYALPPLAALTGSRVGWVGYAAGVTGRLLVADRVESRRWPDSLAHPASVLLFDWLVARSLLRRRRGELQWKGRPLP